MRLERFGVGHRWYFGLHGWSGDRHTFARLVRDLPLHVTFWSADLPGCGESPAPKRWELASVADEIVSELRRLGRPVTMVGNCSGALLGLMAARMEPAAFDRLVLIDAFAFWPWYFKIFLRRDFGRYAYYSTFANPLGRWIANASLRGKRQAETDLTAGFARVDHEVGYRYLSMLRELDAAESYRGLSMPVDVVYGERSFEAVRESAQVWTQLWPHARVWELRGAGHLPIQEATGELRAILFEESLCPKLTTLTSEKCAR